MLGLWQAQAVRQAPPRHRTYYAAIPVAEAGNKADGDGCIDLSNQDTRPLLASLVRNFSAAGRENPFIMEVQLCSSNANTSMKCSH